MSCGGLNAGSLDVPAGLHDIIGMELHHFADNNDSRAAYLMCVDLVGYFVNEAGNVPFVRPGAVLDHGNGHITFPIQHIQCA